MGLAPAFYFEGARSVRARYTPSFFCRLVNDVVYWNSSFLSG